MEVFVSNIPSQCTDRLLNDFFSAHLAEFRITVFLCQKFRNKSSGRIVLRASDTNKANAFLAKYGVRANAPRQGPSEQLFWNGLPVTCRRSNNINPPDDFVLRSLAFDAQRQASVQGRPAPDRNQQNSTFAISSLECGTWTYVNDHLTFVSQFTDIRSGKLIFGHRQAAVLFDPSGSQASTNDPASRVDISYHIIDTVTTGTYEDPTISFTLECPPRCYRPGLDIADMLARLNISTNSTPKKVRLTSISSAHAAVAGTCFVYRLRLVNMRNLPTALHLMNGNRGIRSVIAHPTSVIRPATSLRTSSDLLDFLLTEARSYGNLPYDIKFQLLRLVRNGALSPERVTELLPAVASLRSTCADNDIVQAIRRLYQSLLPLGPHIEAHEYSPSILIKKLQDYVHDYNAFKAENPYELAMRHSHIALIHKLTVTPAGTYLEGPEPEVTNRVLRQYSSHTNYFLRVNFVDEDGEPVRYDPRADQSEIYEKRFNKFMDAFYVIAGRNFSFLGFSHSSLRSQTCWFMAPFESKGTLMITSMVIRALGDFTKIRSPARCAARIGQAFSDTTGTVEVEAGMLCLIPDVERNGRVFSDGIGTVSLSLLKKIWPVYGVRRPVKPTVLQIRYAGAKGVVSLDSRLVEDQFNLRKSMEKFTGSSSTTLEVCGAAWHPYPMVLNRQFIKILEDLGVPQNAFMNLQSDAVEELRKMTTSTFNASVFLRESQTSKAAQLPNLLETLNEIGLEYFHDPFLRGIVEMAIITKLRDIKYRGRIPVELGVTLYGIMDETGFLQENQIYVVTKKSDNDRQVLTGGKVIVTRSPALHPGDIRVVEAVDVPAGSALNHLHNCVVFSQHGFRDLPSCLSGGDLDGDLYNVIFDPKLMPRIGNVPPADYPRVAGVEIEGEVTAKHMSDFFIQFMVQDTLGQISTAHLQIADQKEAGVFDPDCLQLAGMASTAVDFPKTGIPVNMREMPRYPPVRPDFMAPSPRAVMNDGELAILSELEEEEHPADPINDLEPEFRRHRFYRSEKVLGHLYRAIDEHQFLERMKEENRALAPAQEDTVLSELWDYIQRNTVMVQWDHHKSLAKQIKDGYEQSLLQTLYQYASSPHHPLTETELFSGNILGNGRQSKRLREVTQTMREQFEEILAFTVSRIVDGDYEAGDRNEEALPRAIACFAAGMAEAPLRERRVGELKSWKYIAAGVMLREIKRWFAVGGRHVLPRV